MYQLAKSEPLWPPVLLDIEKENSAKLEHVVVSNPIFNRFYLAQQPYSRQRKVKTIDTIQLLPDPLVLTIAPNLKKEFQQISNATASVVLGF